MSEIVDIPKNEYGQQGKPLKEEDAVARPIQPPLPSLELTSKDDKGLVVMAPKLTLRKRNSDFALASYNSAFLEGLFEDIANTKIVGSSEEDHGKDTPSDGDDSNAASPDRTTEATCSVALPSDHNLAKRRRVSTNKSLGRCGQSLANLAACDGATGVRKKSSVLISPKCPTKLITSGKMELPATVSASYSFHLDVGSHQHTHSVEGNDEKNQQGDFGWFIDTDDHHEHRGCVGFLNGLSTTCGTSSVPLAFSAPTAPLGPSADQQAEVEWAQAADTVDEVLGDLF